MPLSAFRKVLSQGKANLLRSYSWKRLVHFYNRYGNPLAIKQRKAAKSIPIIINNFNQLTGLKNLIEGLKKRGYHAIYVIDNHSTYPPLLDYYKTADVTVFLLEENLGHQALWKRPDIFNKFKSGYYIVSDPDILLHQECPDDFVNKLIEVSEHYFFVTKVGLALRIDDIPDYNLLKDKVIRWEQKFWTRVLEKDVYLADIDTTFALYRPYGNIDKEFLSGIRVGGSYTAKHEGWYMDQLHPNEEEEYYMKSANQSTTWILDKDKKTRDLSEKYL